MIVDDEQILFADENNNDAENDLTWRVLIVDDEPDVHLTTEFALKNSIIVERKIEFLHAYSGKEAIKILSQEHDIAVILLDVVMENDEEGLEVAKQVRNQLNLQDVRIILRTGHPGYAPEFQVIRDYAINDYKNKAELTQNRLLTMMTTAIRSYQQIRAINTSRRGLEMIIEASASLFERRSIDSFAYAILNQLAGLLALPSAGIICNRILKRKGKKPQYEWQILASTGHFTHFTTETLTTTQNLEIANTIEHTLRSKTSLFENNFIIIYLPRPADEDTAIYLETNRALSNTEIQLIEVFSTNISVGFENLTLFKQMQDLAYIDPLCHIANRTQFVAQLSQLYSEKQAQTVLLVDIDHFSQINDALGHLIGDQLLQSIVQRIKANLKDSLLLARVAIDVFAIAGAISEEEIQSILDIFIQPFSVASHLLRIHVTVAAANIWDTDPSGIGCLKDVTIALNQAKKFNRGELLWYSPAMSRASKQRLDLLHDLEKAIKNEQLTVYYQPQINLATGYVIGVEALVRWPQPDGGFIPPDQFIPLAEQSGLIIELGTFVLETVCKQLNAWRKDGLDDLSMAVNVSMIQFNHPGLINQLANAIQQYNIPTGLLEVEITESVAMKNPDAVIQTIEKLKKLGIKLAIDDFGTGFSSLAYLQKLNADRLKIDRAFVRNMALNNSDSSIAEMVINLGHKLGISVIAEGVEFPQQASILRTLGCDEAQGFMFAKPAPANSLTLWFKETGRYVAV
ncbi:MULTISPECIES: two-component system response regulator [Deefgea]|uniref:EAL domain-containing protein n=1 Tax=Deefgea chitinilytica TaxID=570276 RepID=A0ABS2C9X3_9NEIS|nr:MULTISPECIES: EAL domain-containing protein [Deefgea]MBM5570954.1 EAL domain-containing protein [Deefgea chitinilytica]MBM9888184.1 EAL domain-containing protein [Deefgea sp. CFH1-16]